MRQRNTLILLGIAALVIIAGAIWLFTSRQPATAPTGTGGVLGNTTVDTSNWIAYPIPGTPFSFKYPPDWNTQIINNGNNTASFNITSPSNFTVSATGPVANSGGTCISDPNTEMGSDQITVLDHEYTIYYFGNKQNNTISYAYLSNSNTPCPNMSSIQVPSDILDQTPYTSTPGNPVLVSVKMFYNNQSAVSADTFKSQDLQMAKAILTSTAQTNE